MALDEMVILHCTWSMYTLCICICMGGLFLSSLYSSCFFTAELWLLRQALHE